MASTENSFDVVIPSLPGYIFSSPPAAAGYKVLTIATDWANVMSALNYPKFIAHGGDIGAGVSTAFALREEPAALLEDIRLFARRFR